MSKPFISLDAFAERQFDSEYKGGTIINFDKKKFIETANQLYDTQQYPLKDGYAPFCKHIFVPNFANCEVPYLEITKDNEHLLRTEYQKRRPEELAVLIRYFPRQLLEENKVVIPKAKYLDLILYSREQVEKENKAMGAISKEEEKEIPWALISVKAQDDNYELPMSPITMMRNALPLEEGGSGVKLDKPKYEESVAYWNKYATIQ